MATYLVKIAVQLNTQNGVFYVLSAGRSIRGVTADFKAEGNLIPVQGELFQYKDLRAKKFIVFASDNNGTAWRKKEYEAKAAIRQNLAYVEVGKTIEFATMTTGADPALLDLRRDRDPNRMYVSETFQPRTLLGRNVHYVGNSASDGIIGFASNAKDISSGQFGQYPLYVFCDASITALEVGDGEIAFGKKSPVSIGMSAIGRKAILSIDGTVLYLGKDGRIYSLPTDEQNITGPIEPCEEFTSKELDINSNSALGYLSDTNRRELWIAINGAEPKIYAYSLDMGRWFTITDQRDKFLSIADGLYSLSGGKILREVGSGRRQGKFVTAPIHFGEPNMTKRIRSVFIRFGVSDVLYFMNQTRYDFVVFVSRISDTVHSIEIKSEMRYAHRQRIRRTSQDLGLTSGYGRRWGKFW